MSYTIFLYIYAEKGPGRKMGRKGKCKKGIEKEEKVIIFGLKVALAVKLQSPKAIAYSR